MAIAAEELIHINLVVVVLVLGHQGSLGHAKKLMELIREHDKNIHRGKRFEYPQFVGFLETKLNKYGTIYSNFPDFWRMMMKNDPS